MRRAVLIVLLVGALPYVESEEGLEAVGDGVVVIAYLQKTTG